MVWPTEEIPNDDKLYLRVHRSHFVEGELIPAAFRDRPPPPNEDGKPGMSTHWCRYAEPEWIISNLARSPQDTGIVSMLVQDVREIPGLTVEHTPRSGDRSHADVFGTKDVQSRLLLSRACKEWPIPIPPKLPV